jgi:hypothetical protein
VPVALWADAQEVSALQNLQRLWCCLRLRVDTAPQSPLVALAEILYCTFALHSEEGTTSSCTDKKLIQAFIPFG